jgi:hypothetical protein
MLSAFHLLQSSNPSVQSVDPFSETRFEHVSADSVQNSSDSRKKFICRPELLSLLAVFEMPKQETRKSQREQSPATKVDMADAAQSAKNCHRKTFLTLAGCGPALAVCTTNLSLHAEQRSP